MNHCFCENFSGNTAVLTGDTVNHIKNVLRMKPGDEIFISDGIGNDMIGVIVSMTDTEIVCEKSADAAHHELPVEIILYQALPKGDKMEMVIQKCTELGVRRIVPVESTRCVVKLDGKGKQKKVERWRKIAQSAAEQSQRGVIPEIAEVISFAAAVAEAAENVSGTSAAVTHAAADKDGIPEAEAAEEMAESSRKAPAMRSVGIFAYENATDALGLKKLLDACRSARKPNQIAIFVGPEGGWTPEEADMARNAGLEWITLGHRILRTETAGMALAAAVMLEIEASL